MPNINISDLRPAGADLFLDSESYLNDLSEGEMLVTGAIGAASGNNYISTAYTCNQTAGDRNAIAGYFSLVAIAV